MIYCEDVLFVENPKTASTSIRNMLRNAGGTVVGSKHWNIRDKRDPSIRKWRVVIVRNPFDRMVSGYLHAARSGAKHRNLSFKEWVLGDLWEVSDGIDFKRTSQFHWTSHCNTILRFEDLETSADIIRDLIGRPDLELPHVHKAEDRGHYRDYYDDETVGVVADRFHHDIHAWGYSYY